MMKPSETPHSPEMPDFSEFVRMMAFRTLGETNSRKLIGVGFLNKAHHIDMRDLRFPNFVLVVVLRGTGLYISPDGTEFPLSRGSTFVRLPGIVHSNYVDVDSGYVEFYLELGAQLYTALSEMNILALTPPVHRIDLGGDELPRRVWRLMYNLHHAAESELPACVGEMIAILGDIRNRSTAAGPGGKHLELVELACRHLGANFDQPCSLQKFCRQHSIGYENFRKIFRMQTGVSPWRYRIRRKMESATLLLRNSELSLNEIAARLGYHTPYEFSAQFKREFGVAPRHFRQGN